MTERWIDWKISEVSVEGEQESYYETGLPDSRTRQDWAARVEPPTYETERDDG